MLRAHSSGCQESIVSTKMSKNAYEILSTNWKKRRKNNSRRVPRLRCFFVITRQLGCPVLYGFCERREMDTVSSGFLVRFAMLRAGLRRKEGFCLCVTASFRSARDMPWHLFGGQKRV